MLNVSSEPGWFFGQFNGDIVIILKPFISFKTFKPVRSRTLSEPIPVSACMGDLDERSAVVARGTTGELN